MKNSIQQVKKSEPVWLDGNGHERPLRTMDTSHIINCINMLTQKYELLNTAMDKFNFPNCVPAEVQLEIWADSIRSFFAELERRGTEEEDEE